MPQQPNIDWSKLPDNDGQIDLSGLPDQEEPKVDLKNFKPVTPTSTSKGLWSTLTDPIAPRTTQGGILDAISAIPDVARGMWNHPKETIGGFGQGVMEGIKSFSPLDLIDAATLPFGGPKVKLAQKILSPLIAAKGVQHVSEGEGLTGAAEILGGGAGLASGMRGASKVKSPVVTSKVDILPPEIPEIPRAPLGLPARGETSINPQSNIRPFIAGRAGIAAPETSYAVKQGRSSSGRITRVEEISPERNVVPPERAAESSLLLKGNPRVKTELAKAVPPKATPSVKNRIVTPTETGIPPGIPSNMYPDLGKVVQAKIDDVRLLHGGLGAIPENLRITDLMTFNKALMGSADMSAPFRQALPLVHTKEFWKNMTPMVRSLGSQKFFDSTMQAIDQMPSRKIMDRAGLALTDGLTRNEEQFLSRTAGKLPWVKSANRAFTAFLNKTRADVFTRMVDDASKAGIRVDDESFLRALGTYVNDATGRSTLGKLGEPATNLLNVGFFSPRLIASRVKFLNPYTYINPNTPSFVRKQYLKSFLSTAAFGTAFAKLAELAGAQVGDNPTSSDFGKIKIGETRLDPWGGFEQYGVLGARMLKGEVTSSKTDKTYQLNTGRYGTSDRKDLMMRFAESKANPAVGFIGALLSGKDFTGQPVNIQQETARLFIPLIIQDMWELAQSDHPELIPIITPLIGLGMSGQTYSDGPRSEILTDSLKGMGIMKGN